MSRGKEEMESGKWKVGNEMENGKWKIADKLLFMGEFLCPFLVISDKKRTKRNAA